MKASSSSRHLVFSLAPWNGPLAREYSLFAGLTSRPIGDKCVARLNSLVFLVTLPSRVWLVFR